jgi:isoleucyl-tRNA synthetase
MTRLRHTIPLLSIEVMTIPYAVISITDPLVLQSTTNFISTTLSSFYFDAVKDTLYCQVFDSPDRLAVVATLREVSRPEVDDS